MATMLDYICIHIIISGTIFTFLGVHCRRFPGKYMKQCAILAVVWPLTIFILTLKYITVTIDEVLK
jgi:predicted membrane channel-forming protein YqfA (hemolysin III family)